MKDDGELIQRFRDGDDGGTASRLIFQKYQSMVFHCVYRILENREDAEEVTDDTFDRAFRKIDTLNEPAKLPGWLKTIANRLAIDWLRQAEHQPDMQVSYDENIHAAPVGDAVDYRSTEQYQIRQTRVTLVDRLMRLLPKKDRWAMEYHYCNGLTYKEIAVLTGTTEKAVANRVERARKFLTTLANRFDDWCLSPNKEATAAIDLLFLIPENEAKMAERYLLDQRSLAETAQLAHVSPRVIVNGLKHAMKQWKKIVRNVGTRRL